MGKPWSIKEYGEQQVIAAVRQRGDQRQAAARTIAALYWSEVWEGD